MRIVGEISVHLLRWKRLIKMIGDKFRLLLAVSPDLIAFSDIIFCLKTGTMRIRNFNAD